MDDILHLLPLIKAAMIRVQSFSHLTERDFDMELLWQLRQVTLTEQGNISWRKFPLGTELFLSLGESQNWRCCYCGVRMRTDVKQNHHKYATIEHVRTLFHGGTDHPNNLAVACRWCNQERGKTPLATYLKSVQPYYSQLL